MSRTKRGGGDVMHTVLVARVEEQVRCYGLFDGRGHDVSTRQTATLRAVSLRSERRPKGLPALDIFHVLHLRRKLRGDSLEAQTQLLVGC